MGVVWRARDERLAIDVAIKFPTAEQTTQEDLSRMRNEAQIGARVGRHDGFIRALDLQDDPSRACWLVMDLVPDARPLDLGCASQTDVVVLVRRAALLVLVLHERGLVHRWPGRCRGCWPGRRSGRPCSELPVSRPEPTWLGSSG